ncbi:MAG: YigZ family protein [Clostridia bacterium]|nr:YigZ family protein [Clostridia bacterium]
MAKRITLGKEASAELVEKKSVFIGYSKPIESEEEALEFIAKIKKKHSDARHNVYAYMLRNGAVARYSDDGEPQGTAGIPVLDIIRKGGFCDAVIVVTRYFGGILLGAGGLVRAYSSAAKLAVDASGVVVYDTFKEISLSCSYQDHGKLTVLLASSNIINDGIDYSDSVTVNIAIPEEDFDAFSEKAAEITAGRALITERGTRFDIKTLS